MKTDFVNNMTHEFKTPIATISLASEMLTNPSVQDSRQKIAKYANIIYDENNRLKSQVEQVLQISVLDKRDFKLMKKEFNIHEIIENAVENYQLVVEQRNGKMILDLKAEPSHIFADPVHFYNIISNLIDNAIKYSEKAPIIKISTSSLSNGVSISIEDNGIGISPENIKLVFKKLYRIPTGNLHDAKGFGLGLYYVKTMVEAHGGKIKLRSELKKGSTFELFFPFNHNSNIH
jgi:two-component system phosphate regulon sensor histidine kinase PhoR